MGTPSQLPLLPHFHPRCKVCDYGDLFPKKVFRLSGPVVAIGFILLIPFVVPKQENPKTESTQIASQGVSDRFIGVWKLRVEKMSNRGTFSQLITIEGQGKDYKFTYDQSAGNGEEYHWWYVTDMKGEIVKPVQVACYPYRFQRFQSGRGNPERRLRSQPRRPDHETSKDLLSADALLRVARC
jgi:hypothetical protein